MTRALAPLLMPGGLLLILAVIFTATGLAARATPAFIELMPNGVWAVGLLLGWRFNRGRLVYALIVLALADRAMWHLDGPGSGDLVRHTAAVLVPLNLMVICLAREKGVAAGRGFWRPLAIAVPAILTAVVLKGFPGASDKLLNYRLLSSPVFNGLPLPQPAILALALSLSVFAYRLMRRRNALEIGFFWATLAAASAFAVGPRESSTIFMSTAGIILTFTIIESAYGMAYRDELTALPARRALNESMLRLDKNKYAVAMVDIDFFKKFNDTYGHDIGDQVLCMVGAKLAQVTGGGMPFRYGGEEFTVLFPKKTAREALPHLELLRETIAETEFVIRAKNRPWLKPRKKKLSNRPSSRVSITISVGVASGNGTTSAQKVLKAADQALYRAKKNGRNQVAS